MAVLSLGMPQYVPSWLTVELVLGIIGTVTGILGLIMHLIRLRRERASLHIEVLRCQHRVTWHKTPGESKIAGTLLLVEMRVDNRGDWETTVYDLQLLFRDYSSREKLKAGIRILAHATETLDHSFFVPAAEISDSSVSCSFILYHTHGKQRVGATSSLRGA
jgi:hypothetical protein